MNRRRNAFDQVFSGIDFTPRRKEDMEKQNPSGPCVTRKLTNEELEEVVRKYGPPEERNNKDPRWWRKK